MSELLQLIRDEAPAEQISALGKAGVPEDDLALALEIRQLLADRRRREQALSALFDTAGDLSALRDIEAVLDAIVRRARQLLHSDAAYLMLNDDQAGDTYMRTTDGIETDAFKNVRLELFAGLGGLVAATAQPYYTADYVNDPRFNHTIDDVVSGEKLVAIVGVPLRRGTDVIGVLFSANRHVRPFEEEEIALLISLADHASIAIGNAQLFQDQRRHSESVERSAASHERFTRLVLQGADVAELADTVADALDAPLVVVDESGRVRAFAAVASSGGLPGEADLLAAVRRAHTAARTISVDLPRLGGCTVAPVASGGGPLGALVLARSGLEDTDLRTLERAALVTALVLLTERAVAEAESRARGELLDDLFADPQRDPEALRRRTVVLGFDLDQPHVVCVARAADGERRTLAAAAARLADELGGLAGEHSGSVVVLLPADDASAVAREAGQRLRAALGHPVTVGAAGPAAGAPALLQSHRDAVHCLHILLTLGREGESAAPDDVGVYGLLFSRTGRDELERFVRRTIGPLLDYDAAKSTELLRTINAFFDCDGNVTHTAAALFVHVNTLYQRLERVAALLGDDWRRGERALQVNLACRLHRLMTTS